MPNSNFLSLNHWILSLFYHPPHMIIPSQILFFHTCSYTFFCSSCCFTIPNLIFILISYKNFHLSRLYTPPLPSWYPLCSVVHVSYWFVVTFNPPADGQQWSCTVYQYPIWNDKVAFCWFFCTITASAWTFLRICFPQ